MLYWNVSLFSVEYVLNMFFGYKDESKLYDFVSCKPIKHKKIV